MFQRSEGVIRGEGQKTSYFTNANTVPQNRTLLSPLFSFNGNSYLKSCLSEIEIDRHLSGELGIQEHQLLEEHIEACSQCRQLLAARKQDQALFADLQKVMNFETCDQRHSDMSEFRRFLDSKGYELIEELNRGGQGTVFIAIQRSTNRRVAVKKLAIRGKNSAEQIRRFHREVDALSRLSHPNIVTIFDSGTAGSLPFLVMKFVDGQQFGEAVCSASQNESPSGIEDHQSLRQVLKQFQKLCSAIAYAHRNGVIHRDLKPGNILIDSAGEPQILDFGLAKLADESLHPNLTKTEVFLGTLAYASPEQLQADSNVDVRADIYSLGVILYELLTGKLPHSIEKNFPESIRKIIESDPVPPSQLAPVIDNDVETIILKTLSRDANRRYQSVEQLHRDIELYLNDLPIDAKRESTLYVIRKTLRRHRVFVALTTMVFIVVIVSLATSIIFWREAESQLANANVAKGNETTARKAAEFQSYVANIAAARGAILANDCGESNRRLHAAPEIYRGWEWSYWNARSDMSQQTYRKDDLYITDFDLPQSREIVASVSGDHVVRRWSLGNPKIGKEITFDDYVRFCAINDEGSLIACAGGNSVRILDAMSLKVLHELNAKHTIYRLRFVPGQNRLAMAEAQQRRESRILLWDYKNNSTVETHEVFDFVSDIEAHPTKPELLIAAKRLCVLSADTLEFRSLSNDGYFRAATFDQSGEFVAATKQKTVAIFHAETGAEVSQFVGHESSVSGVALSPSGDRVATCSNDRTIRIWNRKTGEELLTLLGHEQTVNAVQFIDEKTLLSAGNDATFKLWNLQTKSNPARWNCHTKILRDVDFSPDGQNIATASEDATVKIWTIDGNIVQVLEHPAALFSVQYSPDGTKIATAGDDHIVRIRDLVNGETYEFLGHTDRVHSVRFSRDGQRLVSGSRDQTVRIWDLKTQQQLFNFTQHEACVHQATFDATGNQVASRSHLEIKVWDAKDGTLLQSVPQRIGPEDYTLKYHPDGKRLAAGNSIEGFGSGFVTLYDVDRNSTSLDKANLLEQHNSPITGFDFNRDGTRAVSASINTIKLWHVENSEETTILDGVDSFVYCVKFSPDDSRIVAGMSDGTLQVWQASPVE